MVPYYQQIEHMHCCIIALNNMISLRNEMIGRRYIQYGVLTFRAGWNKPAHT